MKVGVRNTAVLLVRLVDGEVGNHAPAHKLLGHKLLDLLPTVHEGVAVRQMEAKGITTDKGDLNRWIRKANNILRDIRKNSS